MFAVTSSRTVRALLTVLMTMHGVLACADARPSRGSRIRLDTTAVDADHSSMSPIALDRLWVADTGMFTAPTSIGIDGSTLIVVDTKAPGGPVQLVDASSGKVLGPLGRRGEGPGEYRNPRQVVHATHRRTGVWLQDDRRLLHYLVRDRAVAEPDTVVTLESGPFLERFAWLNDSTLLAAGHLEHGWVASFDSRGRTGAEFGKVPGLARDSVLFRNHAYAAYAVAHPDGRRFAQLLLYAGDIYILDEHGNSLGAAETPFLFDASFITRNPNGRPSFAFRSDYRTGYVGGAGTSRYLYGLFAGRMTMRGRSIFSGRHIHVLDWEGSLVAVLQIDTDARKLIVDENDGSLYVVSAGPELTVVAYRLPVLK